LPNQMLEDEATLAGADFKKLDGGVFKLQCS
jgi:hypothetical protein